jgi:hypothetical protein
MIGVIFVPPLQAERDDGGSNKILWVVKTPSAGEALHIEGRLPGSGETFRLSKAVIPTPRIPIPLS